MTHPITEPTQSIRERLARLMAAQYHRSAYRGRDGQKEYCDETWEAFLEDLDAILAEMEKPSEGMVEACIQEGEKQGVAFEEFSPPLFFKPIIAAAIQHIRSGGK